MKRGYAMEDHTEKPDPERDPQPGTSDTLQASRLVIDIYDDYDDGAKPDPGDSPDDYDDGAKPDPADPDNDYDDGAKPSGH
jgi:hypothetical protein